MLAKLYRNLVKKVLIILEMFCYVTVPQACIIVLR